MPDTIDARILAQAQHLAAQAFRGWDPHVDTDDDLAPDVAELNALFGCDPDDEEAWTVEQLRAAREPYTYPPDERRATEPAALAAEIVRLVTTTRPRWRRSRATRWTLSQLYRLGIVTGYGVTYNGPLPGVVSGVRFTGRRCYVLGVQTDAWGCLLRRRHWPSPHKVGLGLCAKCAPCPECGEPAPLEHACQGGGAR